MNEPTSVTRLLQQMADGDPEAADAVAPSLYAELRRIAHQQRYRWHGEPGIDTTALLHEAWIKVAGSRGSAWASRQHFFAVCTRAMRHILLNHAEARLAAKRGAGAVHVGLEGVAALEVVDAELILTVAAAIQRLRQRSDRLADIVEHRVFGGFSLDEISELLEVSTRTVKRDWQKARAWLSLELKEESPAWQALSTG